MASVKGELLEVIHGMFTSASKAAWQVSLRSRRTGRTSRTGQTGQTQYWCGSGCNGFFQCLDFFGEGLAEVEPAGVGDEPSVHRGGEGLLRFKAADGFVRVDHFVVSAAGPDRDQESDWQQFRRCE